MYCGKCGLQIGVCKCPDIDARLAKLRTPASRVLLRWCSTCNRHKDRCICGTSNASDGEATPRAGGNE